MTRWLLLGGTGTVGRELSAQLARTPGNEVMVAARSRVLLEEMSDRLGCESLQLDVSSVELSAADLPEVDVVVDLTYPSGRHPRAVIRQAERTIRILAAYLQLHPTARLIHATTFVVPAVQASGPTHLSTKLAWRDGYVLAKTASERALRRRWNPGQMQVVRLGNVVTGDSPWAVLLLRALRAGAVANPDALRLPAGLTSVPEVLALICHGASDEVLQTNGALGWSWGEVLATVAQQLDIHDANAYAFTSPPTGVYSHARGPNAARLLASAVARRALWLAPIGLGSGSLDARPVPPRALTRARRLLQPQDFTSFAQLPPMLPVLPPVPGGLREKAELDAIVEVLARAYIDRGYAVG